MWKKENEEDETNRQAIKKNLKEVYGKLLSTHCIANYLRVNYCDWILSTIVFNFINKKLNEEDG